MGAGRRSKQVREKRGPGKAAKRQPDAVIPKSVLIEDGVIDVGKSRSRTAKKVRANKKNDAEKRRLELERALLEQQEKTAEKGAVSSDSEEDQTTPEVEGDAVEGSESGDVVADVTAEVGKKRLEDVMDESSEEELADEPDLDGVSDSEEELEEMQEDIDPDVARDMLPSDDEEISDAEDKLEAIERKQRERSKLIAEGKGDVDIHIDTLDELPTAEQLEQNNLTDVDVLQDRIRRNIATLKNFAKHRNPQYSRVEYLAVLKADLCAYYSYNDYLMGMFMDLLPLDEICEFLEANEKPRPTVIRTNTLKARRGELAPALIARGVNLDALEKWSNTGLVIHDSNLPIGATPEYLCGHYMLQGACSQLPVIALGPKPGERVLDCSAAPGGKTTHMAALMRNSGVLVANDANKDRQKSTIANLHRLNCCNTICSVMDGRDLAKTWGLYFNKVLLDAPCSGTGVISKDPAVKMNKDESDIKNCAFLQKEMIISAVDSLNANTKGGAFMVYCTCSLMVAENEEVVDYILRKRNVKVVETGLSFGTPGFTKYGNKQYDKSISMTRRFYPHKDNMDGFFVCKLQKLANGEKLVKHEKAAEVEEHTKKREESRQKHQDNIKAAAEKKKARKEFYEKKVEIQQKKKAKKEKRKEKKKLKEEAAQKVPEKSSTGEAEAEKASEEIATSSVKSEKKKKNKQKRKIAEEVDEKVDSSPKKTKKSKKGAK